MSSAEPIRDLGEQPLTEMMKARDLLPKDLVEASSEQITHKMVSRAMKGRRLTARTMNKVMRAWNRAAEADDGIERLFNYTP
ncbi:MAG: hypothetical protein ACI841_000775 [Planctomycetota bacterium]|jgi:hypothetical protein